MNVPHEHARALRRSSARSHDVHPTAIKIALVAATWFVLAMTTLFGGGSVVANYLMAVVIGFSLIFFTLTVGFAVLVSRDMRWGETPVSFPTFMRGKVATATGKTDGREVLAEILVLPVVLAVGATVIGLIFVLTGG